MSKVENFQKIWGEGNCFVAQICAHCVPTKFVVLVYNNVSQHDHGQMEHPLWCKYSCVVIVTILNCHQRSAQTFGSMCSNFVLGLA